MTLPVVLAIAGCASLLVGIYGGGVKAEKLEVPKISTATRIVSSLIGMLLIAIAIWISSANPLQPSLVTPEPITTNQSPIASESPANVPPSNSLSIQKLTSSDYGKLLYEETFDTDNGLWSLDAGGQIQNGSLTLPPGASTSNWNKKYSDFIVETAFQFINVISSSYSAMSVYLRYGPCTGSSDPCNDQVGLTTNGVVLAWNHINSTKQILAGTRASEFNHEGINKLTVIVSGSEFKIFVNDVFVRGFTDPSLEKKSGNIVFDVDGTSIAFDYVRIYELP